MKKLIATFLTLGVLISACGPKATPTIDPAQVQASAVAAASTMIALTQAAIPTATPIPPTDTPSPTPLPTFTPAVLATLPLQASSPTPLTSSGSGDDCNHTLDIAEAGPLARFRIQNETTGTVNISLFMAKNAFGQCGYISVSGMAKNTQSTIQAPLGCWSAYAWSTGKTNLTTSGYLGCVNNTDLWNVFIRPEAILLKSP